MQIIAGAQIGGKYRLERQIGIGGMGEVWAAVQTVTRKPVALKFLRESDVDTKRRFLREARAACAVRHPNVVEVHDVLELEDGAPVMVMELLEGESLEARLKRDGRMQLGDLASVMVRVVAAVGTAHALGIVHRDLKPDNIFLAQTPDGVDVKVLDFGIAKLTALDGDAALTGGLTNTGTMLGTPFYMSPEQAFGERRIDHRADIWSLGIILYRGLSGVLPTKADNIGQILKIIMTRSIPPLAEVAPGLPADILELVGRMLSQEVSGRPRDLRDVKAVLERYAGMVVEEFSPPASQLDLEASSAAGHAVTPSASQSAKLSPASSKWRLVLAGIAVALTALALGGVFAFRRGPVAAGSPGGGPVAAGSPGGGPSPVPSSEPMRSALASNPPPVVVAPSAAPSAIDPLLSAEPQSASATRAPTASASAGRPWGTLPRSAKTAAPATSATAAAAPAKTSVGGVVTNPSF